MDIKEFTNKVQRADYLFSYYLSVLNAYKELKEWNVHTISISNTWCKEFKTWMVKWFDDVFKKWMLDLLSSWTIEIEKEIQEFLKKYK